MLTLDNARVPCHRPLILLAATIWAIAALGQQTKSLPDLRIASVPFHPRNAQAAHIEGVVRLRISTDGTRAVSVQVQDGPPMLARAARDNVKTWQFEPHAPTTSTQFRL